MTWSPPFRRRYSRKGDADAFPLLQPAAPRSRRHEVWVQPLIVSPASERRLTLHAVTTLRTPTSHSRLACSWAEKSCQSCSLSGTSWKKSFRVASCGPVWNRKKNHNSTTGFVGQPSHLRFRAQHLKWSHACTKQLSTKFFLFPCVTSSDLPVIPYKLASSPGRACRTCMHVIMCQVALLRHYPCPGVSVQHASS